MNFVQLTGLNGPVWVNLDMVVTMSPQKKGGTHITVVGENGDFYVYESVEQIKAARELNE